MAVVSLDRRKTRQDLESRGLKNVPQISAEGEFAIPLEELNARVVSDRSLLFTEDEAIKYIELPVFAGERDAGDSHVQYLYDEMLRKRFNWDAVTLARSDFGSDCYKINGQHTSWARLWLPRDYPSPRVRAVHYAVDSESQLKALYSSYDRAKTRSDLHLTRLELVGSDAVAGLNKNTVTRLPPGVRFWLFATRSQQKACGPAELAILITRDHAALFRLVGAFFETLDRPALELMCRQPVLAALFATFDRVPTVAPLFWQDVADGTNLVKSDARWHLRHYLTTTCLSRSAANGGKRGVDSEEMYRMCIAAWNKWRENATVQALRPSSKRVKPS